MGTARLLDWLRRSRAARHAPPDEETAELTASYWRAYDARMASVGLADVARRFPGLVWQAGRLGWSARRPSTPGPLSLYPGVGGVAATALVRATPGLVAV